MGRFRTVRSGRLQWVVSRTSIPGHPEQTYAPTTPLDRQPMCCFQIADGFALLQPHLTCFQFSVLSAVSKIRGPFRSCRSSIRSTLPNPAALSVSTISPNRSHFESADIPEKGSE